MTTQIKPYCAQIHPASHIQESPDILHKKYKTTYTVQLCDKSWLEIPLCALPDGEHAIALLMSNQSSFQVIEHITTLMALKASMLQPDCIVAVPTMGLEYGSKIAQKLGMSTYTALGFSHKFWYNAALSEPVISTTSPDQQKNLYLDPALRSRVEGKRVVVVDDVINTGSSVLAALRLLKRANAHIVGVVIALTEGYTWQTTLADPLVSASSQVYAIGHIPIFQKQGSAWVAQPETL